MQAQQVLVSATSFIADLNKSLDSQSGMHYMYERMQQLDSWINSVLAQVDILPMPSGSPEPDFGDSRETVTAQSIRAISRIKLSRYVLRSILYHQSHCALMPMLMHLSAQIKAHRFRAFSDIPIFIKRHCDLTAANPSNPPPEIKHSPTHQGNNSVGCCCSSLDQFQRASSAEYMTPSDSSTSSDIHLPQYPQFPFTSGFPYSPQHSAKICLRAALVISRMFEGLPYPRPLTENRPQEHQLNHPRTMPSFACCLMQSSYAMFMIFYKARVAKQLSPDSESEIAAELTDHLVEELRQGLERIIGAVSNYSHAFEALDGMRGESSLFSRSNQASWLTIFKMKFKVHIKRRSLMLLPFNMWVIYYYFCISYETRLPSTSGIDYHQLAHLAISSCSSRLMHPCIYLGIF